MLKFCKIANLLPILALTLSACSSSGIEPNWDIVNRPNENSKTFANLSASKNFRLELRRMGGREQQSNNTGGAVTIVRNGRRVDARPSLNSQSRKTLSQSSHSSYVVAQPGYPANLVYDNQTMVFTLGRPLGSSIPVAFGHAGPSTSMNTAVSVPLGVWYSIGGIGGVENNGAQNSRLGSRSSLGVTRDSRNSGASYEIRVSPF